MKIAPFGVEMWMNEHERHCRYNLAETCVESLTVAQLLELSGQGEALLRELLPLKLTYGAIEGSERLLQAVCALYSAQGAANAVITHGAIGANALVYAALVEPGDRVVSLVPNYQQHTSIPQSYGAELELHRLREDNGFRPDLDELARQIGGNTKLIVLSNPNNPTGALLDAAMLRQIAELAARCGAFVLCDEVYRGLDQHGDQPTASIADLYPRGISIGSLSKAFSLAGLRLGWIVGPTELIQSVLRHRDYNTISVGMLDDLLASIALEHRDAILRRNRRIVRGNLDTLDRWVAAEQARISYVKPTGGTVALLKYTLDVPSRELCLRLLESEGVLFTPGSALDMEGYLRIGYANNPVVLQQGLRAVSRFLRS